MRRKRRGEGGDRWQRAREKQESSKGGKRQMAKAEREGGKGGGAERARKNEERKGREEGRELTANRKIEGLLS